MSRRLWSFTHTAMSCVTHFVLVDFGQLGTAFLETEPGLTFTDAIGRLREHDKVVAVFCADEEAGTWRDVTSDVADYLARQTFGELSTSEQEIVTRLGLAPDETEEDEPTIGHVQLQRRELVLMCHFD